MAFALFVVPFLAMLGEALASLTLARDSDGNRIPFAKRIARFKEIHDSHDSAYFLLDHGEEAAKELGIPRDSTPQNIQKAMQERFAQRDGAEPMHFHVQQQEESQIFFYPKDGDPENAAPENRGVKITKSGSKKGLLRVSVIPDDKDEETREPAINQTVIKTMMDQTGPLLLEAANAGQVDMVRDLVGQEHVDVNEKAAFGWTALLAASAQGYPEIARVLLEAGANPDLGNAHGITPLMYGARYGNAEICAILLEYQAELNLQDVYGMSALIVATRDGHLSIVDLLIKAGADTALKTRHGMSALDFAYACKHGKIAKRLRQANKSIQATK